MDMKKQTAVEWLAEQLKSKYDIDIERLSVTDKAKEMEEQQHEKTYNQGLMSKFQTFEHYWNETFKD